MTEIPNKLSNGFDTVEPLAEPHTQPVTRLDFLKTAGMLVATAAVPRSIQNSQIYESRPHPFLYTFESGFGYRLNSMANYDQGDSGWANERIGFKKDTMSKGGCAPTAAAMVVATMNNNPKIRPDTLAWKYGPKYFWRAQADGHGNWDGFFDAIAGYKGQVHKYGGYKAGDLRLEDIEEIPTIVQHGGMAIALADAGGYFTFRGHFIVLRAADQEGLYIADPAGDGVVHNNTETRPFTPEVLAGRGKNDGRLLKIWAFV
ncbi:MAG TPA: C39 family peptidase [Candidatus Saccharimonadales bacterium]|nr:C39 family peptidase [Candidatus Saccharimonadales bacterium]